MPIMAAQDQNDVRGSARVLASAAKHYLDQLPADDRHIPAMNGVFRLLKVYKASRLQAYEYQPSIDRGPEAVYTLPNPSRHVGELRTALELALQDAGRDRTQDVTIQAIQDVLRQVASRAAVVDDKGRRTATTFLNSLLQHLTPAG